LIYSWVADILETIKDMFILYWSRQVSVFDGISQKPNNSGGRDMLKEKPIAQVNVFEELEYQAGGTVSRVLLKQPSGSVTAFAFEEGQELSEHTCPYEALIHVLEGEAEVTIGGVAYDVKSSEMIPLPAGVPHAVRAPGRFKMLLTMFRA
jgi:quercetin dioxygenase-like cupin family protein